jgi:GH25 family lysozyme M1 (1,4-beta-N-acetylmuramidase)
MATTNTLNSIDVSHYQGAIKSFWNSYVGDAFANYPLRIAKTKVTQPSIPANWTRWTFWQSAQGQATGITRSVDLNAFMQ